ncbi:NepR family anti-sigma factor [Methylobacterium sp. WL120]|uniref:NepR family anti-sigma factor n=1 Tax=Methylobacterium sp. WL120 TaxID=2603887 RepID=UPI0011CBADB8|nr:NepR family anti-sigma factor [Methylobacterium sp. WL120]TXM69982.1 hypothetical protein FV229_03855 [Methylobacterium sp. WL120]
MSSDRRDESDAPVDKFTAPVLTAATRKRLGRELRALYDPVLDEPLDSRLAELMQQLEVDRGEQP